MATRRFRSPAGPKLSIGALARATGIPVETLRTWESRYGFPVPERKPSGHRVYPVESVARLRRVAQALACGHRAGEVVGASEADLAALLESTSAPAVIAAEPHPAGLELAELLELVAAFDRERLTRALLGDAARLGVLAFLETRVAPLARAAGDAWEHGRLEIRHEHFLTERLSDLLRTLRLPLEERAAGPLVVLASLPGESHALGLQMAALCLVSGGCRVVLLGTEVPLEELARLTRELGARALGVSVSLATGGDATRATLERLRALLPRRVELLAGGDGAAPAPEGARLLASLRELDAWARRAAAA